MLEAALSLPGVQSAPTPEQTARLARRGCLPSLHERASIYLLLADVIMRLAKGGEAPEARKVRTQCAHAHGLVVPACVACARSSTHPTHTCAATQYLAEAVAKFTGTREEVRVMVADCEAAVAAGDTAGALMRLQRVPDSSPHYARARVAMASIYLSHKHDRAAFIKCHLDLVVRMAAACGRPQRCRQQRRGAQRALSVLHLPCAPAGEDAGLRHTLPAGRCVHDHPGA